MTEIEKEALVKAKNKQAYIYKREKRSEVLEKTYLDMLFREAVKALTVEKETMQLCKKLKEHPT